MLARTAGVLSLINIVLGFIALGYVPAAIGSGSPASLHAVQIHEQLYRIGLAAHIVVTATNVGLALTYYELFKVVSRRLAMLDVFLVLVATAVEASAVFVDFVPLVLIDTSLTSSGLTPQQLQALVYLPMRLSEYGYDI